MVLQRVLTFFDQPNADTNKWKQPFNQVCFFNFDVNHPVTVNNSFVIPPAQAIPNGVIPGQLEITLNVSEVNDTTFSFKYAAGSTTNNIVIVYTQYVKENPVLKV